MRVQARLIDLSHGIEDGLITCKGLPAPIICDYLSREDSRSICFSAIPPKFKGVGTFPVRALAKVAA